MNMSKMKRWNLALTLLGLTCAVATKTEAQTKVIDDCGGQQFLTANAAPVSSGVANEGSIGGFRKAILVPRVDNEIVRFRTFVDTNSRKLCSIDSVPRSSAEFKSFFDGSSSPADSIKPSGLGGVNLRGNCVDGGIVIRGFVYDAPNGLAERVELKVFDNSDSSGATFATAAQEISSLDFATGADLFFPYSSFSGASASFTRAGAVSLAIGNPTSGNVDERDTLYTKIETYCKDIATPTPTPSPTPTPPCAKYLTTVTNIGGYGWTYYPYTFVNYGDLNPNNPVLSWSDNGSTFRTDPGSFLTCWNTALSSAGSDNKVKFGDLPPDPANYWMYTDDFVAQIFLQWGLATSANPNAGYQAYFDQEDSTAPKTYSFYLDKACQPSTPQSGEKVCYLKIDFVTPLVLEWDGAIADIKGNSLFPLDPSKKSTYYQWKGSEKTPLLVFDPEHKGQITEASQLFGAFFDGRQWQNGFDALASLDKNSDGVISGAELEPVALWFDKGSDGISDKGEVISAKDAGLIELKVANYSKVENSRDLALDKGFTKEVKGKLSSGRVVDWFAEEIGSKADLLSSSMLDQSQVSYLPQSGPVSTSSKWSASKSKSDDGLAGGWIWMTSEEGVNNEFGLPMHGVLTFGGGEESFKGHSILPTMVTDGSQDQMMMNLFPLNGNKSKNSDGSIRVTFTAVGANKIPTVTEAVLDAKSHVLTGTSKVVTGRGSDGQPIYTAFSWHAVKM